MVLRSPANMLITNNKTKVKITRTVHDPWFRSSKFIVKSFSVGVCVPHDIWIDDVRNNVTTENDEGLPTGVDHLGPPYVRSN